MCATQALACALLLQAQPLTTSVGATGLDLYYLDSALALALLVLEVPADYNAQLAAFTAAAALASQQRQLIARIETEGWQRQLVEVPPVARALKPSLGQGLSCCHCLQAPRSGRRYQTLLLMLGAPGTPQGGERTLRRPDSSTAARQAADIFVPIPGWGVLPLLNWPLRPCSGTRWRRRPRQPVQMSEQRTWARLTQCPQ